MAKQITVKVPVRIDLAGGWTDVPAYCKGKTGEVVNIAINHYVTASCEIDEQRRVTVRYETEMPTGCGLGTSGAMNVALIAAISPSDEHPSAIAEKAFQFEAVLGNTGGRQDQWASAFGGIQHLRFEHESVHRTELNPSAKFCTWIEHHLLLFDTGLPHVSGDLHKSVWKRFKEGDGEITSGLEVLRLAGQFMHGAVVDEDSTAFTEAMRLVMKGVDLLNPALHEPFRSVLDSLQNTGRLTAWKAMGAGGGGVVGVLRSSNSSPESIVQDLEDAGWKHLPWAIDSSGITRDVVLNHG
jgi:D-glycero-alpha-D-manno-heptose-7-phosphate kinase